MSRSRVQLQDLTAATTQSIKFIRIDLDLSTAAAITKEMLLLCNRLDSLLFLSIFQDMKDMFTKLQLLRQKSAGKENQNQATELLKRITEEATKMKKEVEDKLRKAEGESLLRAVWRLRRDAFASTRILRGLTVGVHVFLRLPAADRPGGQDPAAAQEQRGERGRSVAAAEGGGFPATAHRQKS